MSNALIGKRLRALRGDTPRKFVAQTLGISVSALQMYENGARVPRDEIKVKLASYYKTTVEAIFFADIPHEPLRLPQQSTILSQRASVR